MFRSQRTLSGQRELPSEISQDTEHHRSAWAWIEYILLIAGIVLLAAYGAFLLEGALGSRVFLRRFAALDPNGPALPESYKPDHGAKQDGSNLGRQQRANARETSSWGHVETPLAVLQIPKIHLAVPLLNGTDAMTLNHAVGRIAGTAWPGEAGNIGIAGHRDSFFRRLKDVKLGDAVELETPTGTDTYIVDQIQIVAPDAVDVLLPRSAPAVTLVTCYPFHFVGSAPQRFIVNASLTQQIESNPHRP
jgi:sortase A